MDSLKDLWVRLGATTRAWMDAKGATPTSLNKATGVGRQTIYNLLAGRTVELETVARVAEQLGATPTQLFAGELPIDSTPGAVKRIDALEEQLQRAGKERAETRQLANELREDWHRFQRDLIPALEVLAEALDSDTTPARSLRRAIGRRVQPVGGHRKAR